jgi:hypothetical protein
VFIYIYIAGQKIVKALKCERFGNGISEHFSNLGILFDSLMFNGKGISIAKANSLTIQAVNFLGDPKVLTLSLHFELIIMTMGSGKEIGNGVETVIISLLNTLIL